MEKDRQPSDLDVNTIREWDSTMEGSGRFWCLYMDAARKHMIEHGIMPNVTLSSPRYTSKLEIITSKGSLTVHSWPREHECLQAFAERLQQKGVRLKWCGQGLAATTLQALEAILLKRRPALPH